LRERKKGGGKGKRRGSGEEKEREKGRLFIVAINDINNYTNNYI